MSWDRDEALHALAKARFAHTYTDMPTDDPRAVSMREEVEWAVEPLRAAAEAAYSDGQYAGFEDALVEAENKSPNPYTVPIAFS